MRVTLVTDTYPPDLNPVAASVERSVQYLRAAGHEVELIRPRQPHEAPRSDASEWRTASLGLPFFHRWRLGLATAARLRERLRQTRPEVVHIATQGPGLARAALRAAQELQVPLTTELRVHASRGWLHRLLLRYLKLFHRVAQCSFVPTRDTRDELLAEGFARVELLGRGVDVLLFRPSRRSQALRDSWDAASPSQVVLLYVGPLTAGKNAELALRAFTAARRLRPSTRMVVVGEGPQRSLLEQRFPEALFVGSQHGETLARTFASADLFLEPSPHERDGTLEALASGLPVVAFDAGSAAEHVRDGQSGMLASTADPGAFIAATSRALALDEELLPLRAQARVHALQVDWPTVLSRLERRLRDVAQQRPRPA